jgi:hypothetical protein
MASGRARVIVVVAALVLVAGLLATSAGPAGAAVRVRWYRPIEGVPSGVASDRAGRSAVVGTSGAWPDARARAWTYRIGGSRIWTTAWRPTADHSTYGAGVAVGPRRVYVVGDVWSPGEVDHPTGWFLRAYRRDGEILWAHRSPADFSQGNIASDVAAWHGGVVTASFVCGEGGCEGGSVSSFDLDGLRRWVVSVGGIRGTADAVTVARDGTAYVTGAFNGCVSCPLGRGYRPYVARLRADGTLDWTHRFPGAGAGVAIDVRSHGIVVAGAAPSGARWLASVDADGAVRWIRTWRGRSIADLDATPAGWIWVTGRERRDEGPGALFVRLYRPDGSVVDTWRRGPVEGVRAAGVGVSWDRRGVSVVGLWDGDGRLWRLRV